MFNFIDDVREELLKEFINILDSISLRSHHLYDKITENLTIALRSHLRKPRCGDKFLV